MRKKKIIIIIINKTNLGPAAGLGGASGQVGSAIVGRVNMRDSLLINSVHQVATGSRVTIPLN
jgi:hypothetical protein